MNLKRLSLYLTLLVLPGVLVAQNTDSYIPAKTVYADSAFTAKAFPLLNALLNMPAGEQTTPSVKKTEDAQTRRVAKALKQCKDVSCYADALQWTSGEIKSVGDELVASYQQSEAYKSVVRQLREKGSYALYENMADTAYLRHAWNDVAKGIHRIFRVYIKGEKPHYAKIDSISFAAGDVEFKNQLKEYLSKISSQNPGEHFFDLPLKAATGVLAINGRSEATNYEPLNGGMNREPYERISKTDFSAYPYSVLIIPGLGPEEPGMALEPRGAKRAEEGAAKWRKGLAPFIVVTGGNVHPFKTPFNEAEEMKKYMVRELGIPADVIFIEPHARHTTTNIRNTTRMIYRFGIPANKPVLITTDVNQSTYITQRMDKNAMRDLGYLPYDRLRKVTDQETEFYPTWKAMQADPSDPLDP